MADLLYNLDVPVVLPPKSARFRETSRLGTGMNAIKSMWYPFVGPLGAPVHTLHTWICREFTT